MDAGPVGGRMHLTLACGRCGARLAPTLSGMRCPRLTACGFGGQVETLLPRSCLGNGGVAHA
jgi:hypothetical protein